MKTKDCTFHKKRFPDEAITRPVEEFYVNKQNGGYYKVCIRCRKRIKHLKDPNEIRRQSTEGEKYLHFQVDEELHSAVHRVAKLQGCTMAYYMQEMIREHVYNDILELARTS